MDANDEWGRSSWDVREGIEPADRADCRECQGKGCDADGVECEYCNATGTERTRDELANRERAE